MVLVTLLRHSNNKTPQQQTSLPITDGTTHHRRSGLQQPPHDALPVSEAGQEGSLLSLTRQQSRCWPGSAPKPIPGVGEFGSHGCRMRSRFLAARPGTILRFRLPQLLAPLPGSPPQDLLSRLTSPAFPFCVGASCDYWVAPR